MIDDLELEQLFVRRRAGRIEASLVLEDPAGGRHRETLPLPYDEAAAAVAALGRHLARRGDVTDAPRLRVREETGGRLVDRPAWRDIFLDAFDGEFGDGP